MIPKRIHQIWLDFGKGVKSPPEEQYGRFRRSWQDMYPEHEYMLWNDEMGERLVRTEFPAFWSLYRSIKPIQRADMLRIFILAKHGGIYADMDTEAMKSFQPLTETHHLILAERRALGLVGVTNCLICSVPRHPFLTHTLDMMVESRPKMKIEFDAWYVNRSFGSVKLSRAWRSWVKKSGGNTDLTHRILSASEFWNPGTPRLLAKAKAGRIPMPFLQHQQHQSWAGGSPGGNCPCSRKADTPEKICMVALTGIIYLLFAVILFIMLRWSFQKWRAKR